MNVDKYNFSVRVMHWLMAVLIICMLASGLYMKSLPVSNSIKFDIYTVHKACGMTILVLVVMRVFLRIFTHAPPFSVDFSRLMIKVANFTHYSLYILMVLMPLSGYFMSSASGIKIKYFFNIPLLISKNKELAILFNKLHSVFAYMIILFIVLHVLGALKHMLIDRQNVLRRII